REQLDGMQAGATAKAPVDDHAGHRHGEGKHNHGEGEAGHTHEGGILGPNTELIFSLACGALLIGGYLVEKFLAVPAWLPFA
ncbi:hypothetical protein QIH09_27115, partial [Klebsiella pneumoniae]|nr:hypothetical protein [Klebsiella pneumoniae]